MRYDVFAQDSYQLTQSLNINFGARYDFMQPMHNGNKDLSVFRPGYNNNVHCVSRRGHQQYLRP